MPKPIMTLIPRLCAPALGSALALLLCGWGGLSGCKPVDIDSAAEDTTSAEATDSALIRVTNNIDVDPGTITLALFPGNSIDIVNANKTKDLGQIAYNATVQIRVPAGAWKLAYADRSGGLHQMVNPQDGSATWVKSNFVKNGDYSLILSTDGGNDIVWNPTFTTTPSLK